MNSVQPLTILKQFSWDFSANYNPTSISCYAFSEEEARSEILRYLTKIDTECKSYRDTHTYLPNEKRYITDDEADLNIGCYTMVIEHFHLAMEIYATGGNTTLEEFIKSTSPRVSDFKKISVFSCLDG